MQGAFADKLRQVLSQERLESYHQRGTPRTDLNLFSHYAWNMALSESLYSALQCLEIACRNQIHQSATTHYHRDDWFDHPAALQHENERQAIAKAKMALRQQGKPLEAGRIVAELNFGFWTSLLDRRYEQVLWPRLLKHTFPRMPRKIRTRATLAKRFNTIRRLRNRVFHHEPIWYWRDLPQQHEAILEAIEWLEPAMRSFVETIDRFPTVYAGGTQAFEQQLRKFC